MRTLIRILSAVSLAFVFFSLVSAAAPSQDYYAKVNIWYEDPAKILGTNYHKGAIIPFGAKITITSQIKEKIYFTVADQPGITFILTNIPKHTMVGAAELSKLYFTTADPKAKGTEFDKFNAKEKKNIEDGTIEAGMSKEAVIASYGYPPKHRTPSLTSNFWTYWDSRYVRKQVTFQNNLIINIEEITESLDGPRIYYVP